jgi:hypothetical protein
MKSVTWFALPALCLATWFAPVAAETVDVRYRGQVDLAAFECHVITRSSFIRRVCYDSANKYMLIDLSGTFYLSLLAD